MIHFASKRALRRKSCERKRAYAAESEARHIIEVMRRNGESDALNAYRCTFCGQWHIGHAFRNQTDFPKFGKHA